MLTELARRAEQLKGEIKGALLLAPETPAANACANVRKLLQKTHVLMEEVRTCAAYQVGNYNECTVYIIYKRMRACLLVCFLLTVRAGLPYGLDGLKPRAPRLRGPRTYWMYQWEKGGGKREKMKKRKKKKRKKGEKKKEEIEIERKKKIKD